MRYITMHVRKSKKEILYSSLNWEVILTKADEVSKSNSLIYEIMEENL